MHGQYSSVSYANELRLQPQPCSTAHTFRSPARSLARYSFVDEVELRIQSLSPSVRSSRAGGAGSFTVPISKSITTNWPQYTTRRARNCRSSVGRLLQYTNSVLFFKPLMAESPDGKTPTTSFNHSIADTVKAGITR
jgi:hypothetical protein